MIPWWAVAEELPVGSPSSELVERLASEQFEERRQGVRELAALGDGAVEWVTDALVSGRLDPVLARWFFGDLPAEVLQRHLPSLLTLHDPEVTVAAARSLYRDDVTLTEEVLEEALDRLRHHPDDDGVYLVASALDQVAPGVPSAQRILDVARERQASHELWFFVHLHAPQLLEDSERLDYLLGPRTRVGEIDEGPGVFDVDMSDLESLGLRPEDLAFLEEHRGDVLRRLRRDLFDRGSRFAALLLARLGDTDVLPELRQRLLQEHDSYGWETSTPVLFHEGDHRGFHAYSRAIESLTGRPLEEAVILEAAEIEELSRRADGTALLLLHRLAPEAARQRVFDLFRAARREGRCMTEGNTVVYHRLLFPGTPLDRALELLGPPDERTIDSLWFCCIDGSWGRAFHLRSNRDRVLSFEGFMRDTPRGDEPCPLAESESL